jgi:MFS family permease
MFGTAIIADGSINRSKVYFWGNLSDRMGRKPIILICLATGLVSTAFFGISSTFGQALIFRMITGASYGDVP